MAIALAAGLRFGTTLEALSAGIGAITIGPTSLRGVHRTRAAVMLAASIGMAAGAYVAGMAGRSTIAIVAVTACAAYAYGLLSSLGDSFSAVGLNSMVAVVILGNINAPGASMRDVALAVLFGGLVQTALVVLSWPVGRHVTERRALAKAYRALAGSARNLSSAQATLAPHDPLLAVRAALADPQPLGRRDDLIALQTLADESERMRETLALIATTESKHVDGLPEATADLLDEIARALADAQAPRDGELWQRAKERLAGDPAWQRMYGQIRAAWRSAAVQRHPRAGRTPIVDQSLVPHAERWGRILRENLSPSSAYGRHAIRLATVVALGVLIFRITHLERGYWIALTALLVLRPDFSTTFTRGLARIAGTLAGGVLAWALIRIVPETPQVDAAAGIACAAFGYVVFSVNWALYSVAITAFVIFMLAMTGNNESGALVDRMIATLSGGMLATIAYRVWPSHEASLTRAELADLLDVLRSYAKMILSVYAGDEKLDRQRVERQQHAAWKLRTQVEASIERMLADPEDPENLTRDRALTIFASTRRFGLASLALTSELRIEAPAPILAVRPFAQVLDAAMEAIAGGVRSGASPQRIPDLRAAFTALAASLEGREDRATRVLLAQCDLYADSLNTIAEALSFNLHMGSKPEG